MSFIISCTNRSCGKLMQPYIDVTSDKVHCSMCDGELQVTQFVKHQLKMSKKYKPKKTVAFAVKCKNCGKEDQPLLHNDKDIICAFCKKPHMHLSEPFKIMLRDKLKNSNSDI